MIAGSLEIQMRTDIARIATDMNRTKSLVGNAMQSVESSVASAKAALSSLGVGIGFAAIVGGFKSIVDSAAQLDDVAERTGATVEELSKLSQVARIGGHSMETAEMAMIRLAKALHGADDEAKGAGKALGALGLSADALRGKDTAESLRIVAVELNKYQDGAGKTALAMDLLGKSGAQALPFLKDLANEQGIATRVTTEQAAAAEELQKNLGRLRNEMGVTSQALALKVVPAMNDWIAANREAVRIAGSSAEALRLFVFNLDAMTTEKPRQEITRLAEALERFQRASIVGKFIQSPTGTIFGGREEDLKKQIEFLKFLERQDALSLGVAAGGDTRGEMQRFALSGQKLPLNYAGQGEDLKKGVDLLQKFQDKLRAVQDEILKTQGIDSPLIAMNRLLANDKDLKNLSDAQKNELRNAAEMLGLTKALREEEKEREAGLAEVERAKDEWRKKDDADTTALILKLRELHDPLVAVRREHEAINALAASGAISQEVANFAKLTPQVRELLRPLQNLHQEIQEAWEQGLLSNEQMMQAAERLRESTEKTRDLAVKMGDSFANAFEELVTGAGRGVDAMKALENAAMSVARAIFQATVTDPLKESIKGAGGLGSLWKMFTGNYTPASQLEMVPGQFNTTGNIQYGHTGGIISALRDIRSVDMSVFDGARRFHRGGIVGDEVPIIARKKEGVFTPEQMAAMSPASNEPRVVVDQSGWTFGSDVNQATLVQWGRVIKSETMRAVGDSSRRGGAYRKAVRG